MIKILDWIFTTINNALDVALPWIVLAGLLGYIVYYLVKNFTKSQSKQKKENQSGNVFEIISQAFILLIAESVGVLLFWLLPAWVAVQLKSNLIQLILRWLLFSLVFIAGAYRFGHKNGKERWLNSSIFHLVVIFIGWLVDRWIGILLITVPIILIYYLTLYSLALVTLPATKPEDAGEKWKRFLILASYTWGIQLPIVVVGEHAWKNPEVRIPGSLTSILSIPGMIWAQAHQVIGITGGTYFKRVDGPGLVFTGKQERPFQVVDLRLQLRTADIDVVSKDGISFKAVLFSAFRVDPEIWDKETHDRLRAKNPLLNEANKPSYTEGSFPFSHPRVRATLGTTSTSVSTTDPIIFWDRWALNVIENSARKVISQKTLDELWRPSQDGEHANALDAIAVEIKAGSEFKLRTAGILLYASRIVNFNFPVDKNQFDKIAQQQIINWGSEWERRRMKVVAESEAESERTQQEARAYAESLLLNSIADGLQKTKALHPNLPRYVIAMRFLSALQDYIHKSGSSEKKIEELHNYIQNLESHSPFENDKENPE